MESDRYARGAFTIPGEAGHEELTLRLAGLWGADTVRDSEGTQLSDRILESGYNIYSTLCLVRADNAWAKAHPRTLQQCYLMSFPVVTSGGGDLRIDLLDGFFREQFRVNLDDDPMSGGRRTTARAGISFRARAGAWTRKAACASMASTAGTATP
jgi:beta-D-galactosyl-(1->4)-L-rhamnose phosphorylase